MPALDWEPGSDAGWLPQQAWAQLPDVQPRRPRLGPRPPAPALKSPRMCGCGGCGWSAQNWHPIQSGDMRSSVVGWSLALGASAGLALLFGAFLATADLRISARTAVAPVLAWLILATMISGERVSRNPRRHFRLRRMQRELETAYAAARGSIPAGPTVRLGDPTPRYCPAAH